MEGREATSLVLALGMGCWGCTTFKGSEMPDASTSALSDAADVDGSSGRDADLGVIEAASADSEGQDSAPLGDAGTPLDSALQGAGPLGALPTGFCCASDDDCRYRHCELVNGTKMCLDFCLIEDTCHGIVSGFQCAFTDAGYGFCEPGSGVTSCVTQAQYQHGTRGLGACCAPLSDGRMGTECLSGICAQLGTQDPFLCVQNCGVRDCPPTFSCGWGDVYGLRHQCWPVASNYSCTP
jgi:hypothetical protein